MKRYLFVALVCGLATVPSLGAPSLGFWEEGEPGSIHLVWDLGSSSVLETIAGQSWIADPSEESGLPSPIAGAIISGTDVTYDSASGLFTSPNPIDVHVKINNFPAPNAFKEVWVHATFSDAVRETVPTGIIALDGPATGFTYTPLAGPGPGRGADFGWRIFPNPVYEEVEFTVLPVEGLTTLDTLHVDTICIPAPGAILLAGLGAAVVGWLRTRRSL